MGTSKANFIDSVIKTLKDMPLNRINDSAPTIAKRVLSRHQVKSNLITEDLLYISFDIITSVLNNLKDDQKEDFKNNPIDRDQFINELMEELDDLKIHEKSLLESSYKIALLEIIDNSSYELGDFVNHLFYNFVNELLKKDLYDSLKKAYSSQLEYSQIEKIIQNATESIMNDSIIRDNIKYFTVKKITLDKLIDVLRNNIDHATFGEF